jgi:hypothetical protein
MGSRSFKHKGREPCGSLSPPLYTFPLGTRARMLALCVEQQRWQTYAYGILTLRNRLQRDLASEARRAKQRRFLSFKRLIYFFSTVILCTFVCSSKTVAFLHQNRFWEGMQHLFVVRGSLLPQAYALFDCAHRGSCSRGNGQITQGTRQKVGKEQGRYVLQTGFHEAFRRICSFRWLSA